jgi:hypothetical protein
MKTLFFTAIASLLAIGANAQIELSKSLNTTEQALTVTTGLRSMWKLSMHRLGQPGSSVYAPAFTAGYFPEVHKGAAMENLPLRFELSFSKAFASDRKPADNIMFQSTESAEFSNQLKSIFPGNFELNPINHQFLTTGSNRLKGGEQIIKETGTYVALSFHPGGTLSK